MTSTFRKNLLWLHTWTGLTVGLAMLFLAVTGGVLVMRPHFEDLLNRSLVRASTCAAPLSLDALGKAAEAAHHGDRPSLIEMTNQPGRSVAVQFGDKDYVYLDPCNGGVLGVQNEYGGFFGGLDGLHRFRFVENGRTVAGVLNAAILVLVVIGGVALWWPRSRAAVKGSFVYNRRLPGIARTLSLHKVVGAYAAALLLLLTFTGLPLSFKWAKDLIGWTAGSSADNLKPPEVPPSPPHAKPIKMQQAWEITRAIYPNFEWVSLSYPKRRSGMILGEVVERGAPHKNAKSYVYLDPATGKVLAVRHYRSDVPLARKIYLYVLALHSGLIGGLPYQLALLVACFSVPVQAYSGFVPYIRKQLRKAQPKPGLQLKLVTRTVEANDVCSFEFAHAKGEALPPFSAGSHIDLQLAPGLMRQYSLCNDPSETHRYLIAVRRERDSRGGSRRLHEELKVGDVIYAGPPRNHFPLAHGEHPSLLIAGGIGVTPILCMAERLSNIGARFRLHYCARSMSDAAFADRIRQSSFADRAEFHLSERGSRLKISDLLDGTSRDTHLYVCGPNRLIDEVVRVAAQLGFPGAQVHREYFVADAHDTSADAPFEVRIASTGLNIVVGKDESVVQSLAKHGIEIPTSCAEGVCGSCVTRVLEGEVQHRDMLLSAEERARNDQFTPCCSRASGPLLVLDL